MPRNWLLSGAISILVVLAPLAGRATPVSITVGAIQSIGGKQSFCPGDVLQQAIVQTLSSNLAYEVQVALPESQPTGVQVSGIANCRLGMRQQQTGFWIFQRRSTITTATIELQLQLINAATGATIATIAEQGTAQVAIHPMPGKLPSEVDEPQADVLFEQAIAQALEAMLPQVSAALTQTAL